MEPNAWRKAGESFPCLFLFPQKPTGRVGRLDAEWRWDRLTDQQLHFRNELKYIINHHQYFTIRQRLKQLLPQDPNAKFESGYHVRSLYLDDVDNSALHEKLGGVINRVKYRIRLYNLDDRVIHLEKKIKRNQLSAKLKEPLTRQMVEQILDGRIEVLNRPDIPLFKEVYDRMRHKLLRPVVLVDYVREPFVCSHGNVRITFDKELRSGLNGTDLFNAHGSMVPVLDPFMIMEVKFDAYLPEYIRMALQTDGLVRQSASKYVLCRKWTKRNMWEDQ